MKYEVYYGPTVFQEMINKGLTSSKKIREIFNAFSENKAFRYSKFSTLELAQKAIKTFEMANTKYNNLPGFGDRTISIFLIESSKTQVYAANEYAYVVLCNSRTIMKTIITLIGNVIITKTFDGYIPELINDIISIFEVEDSVQLCETGVLNMSRSMKGFNTLFYLAILNSSTDKDIVDEIEPFTNIKAMCPKPFEKEINICDFSETCFDLMFKAINKSLFSKTTSIEELFWILGDEATASLGISIPSGRLSSETEEEYD